MLMNATLLRIDDPPPAAAGPAISVRCSIGLPTTTEFAFLNAMGMTAARMLLEQLNNANKPAASVLFGGTWHAGNTAWGPE